MVAEPERMDVSDQPSPDLQEHFYQSEHKEEAPQDMHPYLGKMGQDEDLRCPESIEEPEEDVEGLILYQAVEEETMENSLDNETLMVNETGEFEQEKEIPENARDDTPASLADQVNEISEGQMDRISPMDVPVVQACDETAEKAVKQQDRKYNGIELESIYSEYSQPPCPATSISPPPDAKAEEGQLKSRDRATVKTEEDEEHYEGPFEDLALPDGSRDCKNRAWSSTADLDNKTDLLDQSEVKMAATLSADSDDTKPTDLKLSVASDNGCEKKPEQLELPIKVEETKLETAEYVYPDSSDVKQGKLFSFSVKSEELETKAEQLDYPVKPETLEAKAEDLSLPMKPETLDSKPDVLQFAAFPEGTEIKPEEKPVTLGFAGYPDGAKLKIEAKPGGLDFYPDSSEIKPEAKAEGLDFRALPEVKAETKQELLEADSTVLTPKLEQVDGLVDPSGNQVMKGQVKEERPTTLGESFFLEMIRQIMLNKHKNGCNY